MASLYACQAMKYVKENNILVVDPSCVTWADTRKILPGNHKSPPADTHKAHESRLAA